MTVSKFRLHSDANVALLSSILAGVVPRYIFDALFINECFFFSVAMSAVNTSFGSALTEQSDQLMINRKRLQTFTALVPLPARHLCLSLQVRNAN